MKKFIFMIMAFVISTVTMSAQTFEKSKFTDNTYVRVGIGLNSITSPTYNGYENFGETINFSNDLTIGKWVNSVLLFEINGKLGWRNNNDNDLAWTFPDNFSSHKLVQKSYNKSIRNFDLMLNVGFNLNNIIHHYKGVPDKFEFIPKFGIGWRHNYGAKDYTEYLVGNEMIADNDVVTNGALQINYNISDKFQFNVIPSVLYRFEKSDYKLDRNHMEVGLMFGLTYNFKNSHGTHHIMLHECSPSREEYDEINNKVNELIETINSKDDLISKKDKELANKDNEIQSLKNKPCEVQKIYVNQIIGFNIGESNISNSHNASLEKLSSLMKENDNLKLKIVGYSDKETGSYERNLVLSNERAQAVRDALINLGVDGDRITVEAKGSEEQFSDVNDNNRAVIFIIE